MPKNVAVKTYLDMVSIRPLRRNGKPYVMGTVMLSNVEVGSDSLKGEWLEEFTEVRELSGTAAKVMTRIVLTHRGFVYYDDLYAHNVAAFKAERNGEEMPEDPKTLTGETFHAAYVCGTDFYVDSRAAGNRKSHKETAKV